MRSLSSQIQYLLLRNYFIRYLPPPQIYVTICNKIVDPSPLWPLRNFWTAPYMISSTLKILTDISDFTILKSDSTRSRMLKIVLYLTVGRVHTNIQRTCFLLVISSCKYKLLDYLGYSSEIFAKFLCRDFV